MWKCLGQDKRVVLGLFDERKKFTEREIKEAFIKIKGCHLENSDEIVSDCLGAALNEGMLEYDGRFYYRIGKKETKSASQKEA